MGFLLSKLLPPLLMPLGLALLLQLLGLAGRGRRWGPWLSLGGVAVLWLASTPLLGRPVIRALEDRGARLMPSPLPAADAVVVLGGGLRPALPPRRRVEVNEAGDRLLTGVELIREGKAQRLVLSGGRVTFRSDDPAPAEARSAATLARWLGVPPGTIMLSEAARNTAEEAVAVQELANRWGWRSVLLVTSASHLPRATATFRARTDLTVVPVACDFLLAAPALAGRGTPASLALDLMPDARMLLATSEAMREGIGMLVYRLRGWS